MKTKIILLSGCLVVLFTTSIFSQISEPVKAPVRHPVGKGGEGELYYQVLDDTIYTLRFRNAEYERVVDYKYLLFKNIDNTVGALYDAIKSVFLDENVKNKDYSLLLTVGENKVTIANFRMMGNTSAYIATDGGYFLLNEKQLDRLFNKTK